MEEGGCGWDGDVSIYMFLRPVICFSCCLCLAVWEFSGSGGVRLCIMETYFWLCYNLPWIEIRVLY